MTLLVETADPLLVPASAADTTPLGKPALEVADVIRIYGAEYIDRYGHLTTSAQRRALSDLLACRTAALGGHVQACDACGHQRIAYNSCRNRNCPKCQGAARAQWLQARAQELLPVEYFHVVFTLPSELAGLALQNPGPVYHILFQAASATLLQVAANPAYLGAALGFFAILHTWGQNLHLHPHLHCVVPGGGIAPDNARWIACPPGFFLPVGALRKLFRGKFLALLLKAYDADQLHLNGPLLPWRDRCAFLGQLEPLHQTNWVVYAKPPFGGPEQVLKYLARYTHRVAISNHRLIKIEDNLVHFHYKDYAAGGVGKTMALQGVEFLRRFLHHVMPRGFWRIRHFGWMANRHRGVKLEQCRRLLNLSPPPVPQASPSAVAVPPTDTGKPRCPCCGLGHMIVVDILQPQRVRTTPVIPSKIINPLVAAATPPAHGHSVNTS
jgi:hypothetical protein